MHTRFEYLVLDVLRQAAHPNRVEALINNAAKLGFRLVFVSDHLAYMEREVNPITTGSDITQQREEQLC